MVLDSIETLDGEREGVECFDMEVATEAGDDEVDAVCTLMCGRRFSPWISSCCILQEVLMESEATGNSGDDSTFTLFPGC